MHLDCKKALQQQKKDMEEQHKSDFQRCKINFSEQFKKLKHDFEDSLKRLNKEKMQERYHRQQNFLELQKQKREACGHYQGGYGTFSIAFENPVHAELIKCQQQILEHNQELEFLKAELQGAKPRQRN